MACLWKAWVGIFHSDSIGSLPASANLRPRQHFEAKQLRDLEGVQKWNKTSWCLYQMVHCRSVMYLEAAVAAKSTCSAKHIESRFQFRCNCIYHANSSISSATAATTTTIWDWQWNFGRKMKRYETFIIVRQPHQRPRWQQPAVKAPDKHSE